MAKHSCANCRWRANLIDASQHVSDWVCILDAEYGMVYTYARPGLACEDWEQGTWPEEKNDD